MTLKKMFGLGAILALFVAVVVAMLSLVNYFTRDIISENLRVKGVEARSELMEGCDFSEAEAKIPEDSSVTAVYRAEKDGVCVGYCFDVSAKGYNEITMIVGVDLNLAVTGIKILSNTETPGIGSKAVDASYLDSFIGAQDADAVESVSGATLTSKGVKTGIADSIRLCEALLEAEKEASNGTE